MEQPTVLVVNAGSSSLKVKVLPQGFAVTVERLGRGAVVHGPDAPPGGDGTPARGAGEAADPSDHAEALELALTRLAPRLPPAEIGAVGHRVVHGGERYTAPTLLDDAVIDDIAALAELAPLHNPPNVAAIRAARRLLPAVPQVAVFDTAFHATLPAHAFLYGLPRPYYRDLGIRKYGFHGTSHDFVTRRAAELLGRPREALRLVSLHLGNGASAAAVAAGASIDTSMGFTPLDGLLMGTRSGSIDPGVLLHLLRHGHDADSLDRLLNNESGLAGLSGLSNDMRDLRQAAAEGHEGARSALAVFAYRLRTVIGAYAAAMGGLDAVVFTGGIGENDPHSRAEAVAGLAFLGVTVDPRRNRAGVERISPDDAAVAVLVVPTDEERMIAEATREVVAR